MAENVCHMIACLIFAPGEIPSNSLGELKGVYFVILEVLLLS